LTVLTDFDYLKMLSIGIRGHFYELWVFLGTYVSHLGVFVDRFVRNFQSLWAVLCRFHLPNFVAFAHK